MERKIGIGNQDFEKVRINKYFYIDKTNFIREWWESGDEVTLITRPRRLGKTLNMSMLEKFFRFNMLTVGIYSRDFLYGRKNFLVRKYPWVKNINIEKCREHILCFSLVLQELRGVLLHVRVKIFVGL